MTLWEKLLDGDLLGFIVDCYTTMLGNPDLFYGLVTLIVTGVLYIRTQSLLYVSIVWILIGSIFIYTAMPLVSPLASFLLIMGIGGMLYKLFTSLR